MMNFIIRILWIEKKKIWTHFPGLYNFECRILSIIPPVLPILKEPGFKPPTVAGPMIVTFFLLAIRINFLVMFSGIPSAIMAIVRIYESREQKKKYHFCVLKKKDDNFIEKKKLQRRYLREIHGLDGTIVSGS